jgi:hypothetical protein
LVWHPLLSHWALVTVWNDDLPLAMVPLWQVEHLFATAGEARSWLKVAPTKVV